MIFLSSNPCFSAFLGHWRGLVERLLEGSCGCHCQPPLPVTAESNQPHLFPCAVSVQLSALFLMENESLVKILTIFSTLFLPTGISVAQGFQLMYKEGMRHYFFLPVLERLFPSLYTCALIFTILLFVLHFTCFFPLLKSCYLLIPVSSWFFDCTFSTPFLNSFYLSS